MSSLLVKYDSDVEHLLHFAKDGDAGLDLPIKVRGKDPAIIESNQYAELEVGIKVKIPDDAWGLITGRSSTSWRKHLIVIAGIIDSGYTGYLRNLIYNPSDKSQYVNDGDRLAQLIIIPKYKLDDIIVVDELPSTSRGESGFGSSGE